MGDNSLYIMPGITLNTYLLDGFMAGVHPDPAMTISEWADKYRMLPQTGAMESGKYRTDRVPYMREIMDCLSPASPVRRVVVVKPTQIGGTEVANNFLFYIAHYAPGPTMMVLPTVDLAEKHSKFKIAPSLREMDCLKSIVSDGKSKTTGNTILIKEFPGGFWSFTGANSAAGFRSVSIQYLILDDIDGYDSDVGGEGDPVDLAKKRQDSFSSISKTLEISTPTVKGLSRIWAAYEETDQSHYYVPCPECNHMQVLEFGGRGANHGLKWDKDKPGTVKYMCEGCQALIPEAMKTRMLLDGVWKPKYPEILDRGFHLNSLYSPYGMVSWAKIVEEFLAAKKSADRLQVWTNTREALPWESDGERPQWEDLRLRTEDYIMSSIPDAGLFLTAGVDVQADRLQVLIDAWGEGEDCWLIDWLTIFGDPKTDTRVWSELEELLLTKTYNHESGAKLKIACSAIDTGHATQIVYNFCHNRGPSIMAIKGKGSNTKNPGRPILSKPSYQDLIVDGKKKEKAIPLWNIGTHTAKSQIYSRLRVLTPGHGMYHFPNSITDDFFQQLTAEKMIIRYKNGYPEYAWVKPSGARNEALDCQVYALSAAIRSGLYTTNWGNLKTKILESTQISKDILDNKVVKSPNSRGANWPSKIFKSVPSPYMVKGTRD